MIDSVKKFLVNKITPSGWALKLRGFIYSYDFDKILERLLDEKNEGKRFTPPLKYIFRAFEECPTDKLKVVIIGQDPYPYFGVADGIAFSCKFSNKPQAILDNILKSINKKDEYTDMKVWSNQGVLLLNYTFTTQIDKKKIHYNLWYDFMVYILDVLNNTYTGLVFILIGNKALELKSLIDEEKHYILNASFPPAVKHTKNIWNNNNVFNETNAILEQNGKSKINW